MTTFSFVLILMGVAYVVWMLFRLGISWAYAAGVEKGRAESRAADSSGNNLSTFLVLILIALALLAYLT